MSNRARRSDRDWNWLNWRRRDWNFGRGFDGRNDRCRLRNDDLSGYVRLSEVDLFVRLREKEFDVWQMLFRPYKMLIDPTAIEFGIVERCFKLTIGLS